ncbi:hypothetical protein Sinme_0765 [Sinorhizobium meliloti AK83]|nr:hypothetical protein Sinme_0765 [Sinorhizobium meliloti AK83]SEJ01836.1 hypothetical protein SAMN04244575_02737 [Sinorhizobium meliloti]
MIGAELNRSSAAHKGYLVAPNQLAHQANGVADILLGDAEKGGGLMKGDRREVHSSSPPSLTAAFLTKIRIFGASPLNMRSVAYRR